MLDSWYQSLSSEVVSKIGQSICSQYKQVVGYSISMGAYGLLYFSEELLITRAIAFVPQYSIQEGISPYETRWRHEASIIDFQHTWENKISNTEVMFIYDPYASHDQAHIDQYLPHFPHHSLVKLKFLGHPALGGLLESGQLGTLVSSLLHKKTINWQEVRKIIRVKSINVYMVEMLINCCQINLRRSMQLYYYFRQLHQDRVNNFDTAITMIIYRLIYDKKYLPAYLFIIAHSYFSSYQELIATKCISSEKNEYIKSLLPKNMLAFSNTITYGFKNYQAIEDDIKLGNAYRYKQRIYSNKSAGVFTFGPYVYLPASIFKICIEAEIDYFPKNEPLTIKVTTGGGKNIIKQLKLFNLRKGLAFWEIEEVFLQQETNHVEVVIVVPERAEIMLDKISIILQKILLDYN